MSKTPDPVRPAPHSPMGKVDTARSDTATGADFATIVCAEGDLLRLEFEAIIAANFPPGQGQRSRCPPRQPGPLLRTGRLRPETPASPAATACPVARASCPRGTAERARQRSPPAGSTSRSHERRDRTGGERSTAPSGTTRTPRPMPSAPHQHRIRDAGGRDSSVTRLCLTEPCRAVRSPGGTIAEHPPQVVPASHADR